MASGLRRFLRRLVTAFRPDRAETDLAREIQAHLQLLEDQFVARGMTREDARYAAKRAFGGVEQAKELQRDERSFRWLTGWRTDLKLGVRMLVKSPGLTVVAVIALAIAIGAGAAYREFTRDLMFPTLAVPNADRIVGALTWNPERRKAETGLSDFAVWRDQADLFELIGASRRVDRPFITSDGRLERPRSVEISASAFRLFPTAPLFGRMLTDHDEQPTAPPVVVIGHDLWQTRFDANPDILGDTIRIGSVVYTIVGVMPPGFAFPSNQNLWLPLRIAAEQRGRGPDVRIFGRLKPGVSISAAQAQLQGLLGTDASVPLRAVVGTYPLLFEDLQSGETTTFHMANVLFVMFLILCGGNVATLVVARTAMRESEITVRTALGASRGRISAQLFAEALVMSALALVVGLVLAHSIGLWAKQTFMEAAGAPRPFWWDDNLSLQTMFYALALALFAALIVGLIPAFKATSMHLQGRLREAGSSGSTVPFGRVWTGMMITQVVITVIVLTTVASVSWTMVRGRLDYDVTFDREQFLTAQALSLDPTSGLEAPISQAAYRKVADALRSQLGIVNVSYASELPGPIETTWCRLEFAMPEVTADAVFSDGVPSSACQSVGTNYFETIGTPLVAGRLFTESEIEGNHRVAIVDEAFVRLILGGRSALGVMVREPSNEPGDQPGAWYEIIGVVKDVSLQKRKETGDAMLYRLSGIGAISQARMIMRTPGAAAPMVAKLHAFSVSEGLRLVDVGALDAVAAAGGIAVRFLLRIVVVVALVALLLATASIYALISFTLTRRTREIGIRAALGASPPRIITTVLARALTQISVGVLAGALPSAAIMIYGINHSAALGIKAGVTATLAICALVVLIATMSCAAPLRRALRIDPTQALRAE